MSRRSRPCASWRIIRLYRNPAVDRALLSQPLGSNSTSHVANFGCPGQSLRAPVPAAHDTVSIGNLPFRGDLGGKWGLAPAPSGPAVSRIPRIGRRLSPLLFSPRSEPAGAGSQTVSRRSRRKMGTGSGPQVQLHRAFRVSAGACPPSFFRRDRSQPAPERKARRASPLSAPPGPLSSGKKHRIIHINKHGFQSRSQTARKNCFVNI